MTCLAHTFRTCFQANIVVVTFAKIVKFTFLLFLVAQNGVNTTPYYKLEMKIYAQNSAFFSKKKIDSQRFF